MSVFSAFYVWATGDLITAARLNGITNSIVTAGNSIDHANLVAGVGIFASDMKPTTGAQATFGSAQPYTFTAGTILNTNANATVPATIAGNAGGGQTGDLLDVLLAPAGQNMFKLPAVGGVTVTGPTGTNLSALSATGDLQVAPLINALNTLSRVAPVYTTAGAAFGASLHAVLGTATVLNGNSSIAVTLTNAAVFAAAASYFVIATSQAQSSNGIVQFVTNNSASQFTIFISVAAGIGGEPLAFLAIGT